MPMYDYHCASCGDFSALRPLCEYRAPMPCPHCGAVATRVISAPNLACMSTSNRVAWARNERSAQEPRRGSCSSGTCGHRHHHATKPGLSQAAASTPITKPATRRPGSARPWMLGH